jgi:hypothetical protein
LCKKNTLVTPLENSYMNPEECKDLGNHVSQSKNQLNDMGDNVLKMVDLARSQEILKREIENKMDEKME